MWGITIFGLVVVIVAIGIIWAIGAARLKNSTPSDVREDTERELGVRETTVGVEDSPLNRPKTGA
jgi:hypothetical protein